MITVSGEGMPILENASEKGDLLVTVNVVFPDRLSDEQKSLLTKALAQQE